MASIASLVARFKDEPLSLIDDATVRDACDHAGHRWRDRVLGPVVTVRLLILQMLHGNVSCRRLTRITGLAVSVTAYCNARRRLPTDVLGMVLWRINHQTRQRTADFGRWLGHRVAFIDGSGVSMPDTPALQQAFGQPGPRPRKPSQPRRPGFPVMHTLWLFDAATGLLVDFVAGRWNTHDLADAYRLHPLMADGDVLVGDRAFCSYAHIALLLQANLHAVVRMHQRTIIDFTPGRTPRRRRPKRQRRGVTRSRQIACLSRHDQIVEWVKPKKRPSWLNPRAFDDLPGAIRVRELRYTLTRPGFRTTTVTLATTLTDPRKYPRQELADLYGSRWQIEVNLRHLKQTMRMDVLRCKTPDGVKKELLAYAIAYNLVRRAMLDAAEKRGVPPDRISFIDALDALAHPPSLGASRRLTLNPSRPDRDEPRVIKRRKDRYTAMTRPRETLRQELGITRVAA
jgi:hypothetical protein